MEVKSKFEPSFEIALTQLRVQMTTCRRAVLRGEVIAVTYYEQVVGYLVSASWLEKLGFTGTSLELSLTEFRGKINQSWADLDARVVDCLWLTSRDQRLMGFISAQVVESLWTNAHD